MKAYSRILLVQTAFLGDAILTTPLLRAIKQTFPEAALDVLCIPQTRLVFQFNPHIRKIISFDKRKLSGRVRSIFSVFSFLKRGNYDLAVSAQMSLTTSLLLVLAGIPERLGFPRQELTTMTVQLPKGMPVVKRYLRLMQVFSDKEFNFQTELFWDQETEAEVEKKIEALSSTGEPIVGLAPGSVWPTKRWPAEYYANLIRSLAEKGISPVLIGGKEDRELCGNIAQQSGVEPLNMAGELSVLGSAALIERLNLLVTNDSAPLHIANAVKTDVVAMFGPTVERFGFFPFRDSDRVLQIDLACRPCGKHGGKKCSQGHFRCLRDINPETALLTILEVLQKKK